jgi:hypothetical protein
MGSTAWVIQRVRSRPADWFGFETPDHKDIWCYIVAAYAHLEDLSILFLWEHGGQEGQTEDYLGKKNLGALHSRLEETGVLESRVLETIKEVVGLRNGVAHRHGTYGVTEPRTPQGRPMGIYREGHVFREALALETLVRDVSDATSVLVVAALRFKHRNEASPGKGPET